MADEQAVLEDLINKRQKVQEAFSKGAAKVGLAPQLKPEPSKVPTGIQTDVPAGGSSVEPPVTKKKEKKGWW